MVSLGQAITGGATIAVVIKAIDQYSGELKNAKTGFAKLGTLAKGAGIAAAAGLVAFSKASLQAAGRFEQTRIGFETLFKSGQKADKFLKDLAEFTKKTPFQLEGLENMSKRLLAVGFEAEEVIPVLKNIGDVASGLGLGQDGLDRLILNLGQVQAQGKLTGRELRDFANNSVPLLSELANMLGKTTSEVQDMVSKGEISAETTMDAFRRMSEEGGRFADASARQMDSYLGQISNLQDAWTQIKRQAGSELLPTFKELAGVVSENKDAISDLLVGIGKLSGAAIGGAVKSLKMLNRNFKAAQLAFSGEAEAYKDYKQQLEDFGMEALTVSERLDLVNQTLEENKGISGDMAENLDALNYLFLKGVIGIDDYNLGLKQFNQTQGVVKQENDQVANSFVNLQNEMKATKAQFDALTSALGGGAKGARIAQDLSTQGFSVVSNTSGASITAKDSVSAQSGFSGSLTKDTTFSAHAGENVNISRSDGTGGGGVNINGPITIVVESEDAARQIFNDFQALGG